MGDKYTLLAYTGSMQSTQHAHRSNKRKALAFGAAAFAFPYHVVGTYGKYNAQRNLAKKQYGMAKNYAHKGHSAFTHLPKEAKIGIGVGAAAGAGYAAYRYRHRIQQAPHWVKKQVKRPETRETATAMVGASMFMRGAPTAAIGAYQRNPRAFAYGAGQAATGTVLIGAARRHKKNRQKGD